MRINFYVTQISQKARKYLKGTQINMFFKVTQISQIAQIILLGHTEITEITDFESLDKGRL